MKITPPGRIKELDDQIELLDEKLDRLRQARTYPYERWDEQIRPLRAEIAKLEIEYRELCSMAEQIGGGDEPEEEPIGRNR